MTHDARGQPFGPSHTAALFAAWPRLAEVVPWMQLGNWPSPLDTIVVRGREVLVKREDRSADGYAGNKIRPLEMVFGAARAKGLHEIWSTGAYGSNHALAAAVHARRHGFFGGAILWPQPWSQTAADNLVATASIADEVRWARSIVEMPIIGARVHFTRDAWVMPPGAATPLGALGHAGAALELGHQVGDRAIEAIVLPVGSTCTSAGLLVGTALAHAIGLFPRLPRIVAVRVTPWPVTSAQRIAGLAAKTADHLTKLFTQAGLTAPRFPSSARDFEARLDVIGDELGPGYGEPTLSGWAALSEFAHLGLRLDSTYSAKAAALLLRRLLLRMHDGAATVFWATKSAAPLPPTEPARLARTPLRIHRWLRYEPSPTP